MSYRPSSRNDRAFLRHAYNMSALGVGQDTADILSKLYSYKTRIRTSYGSRASPLPKGAGEHPQRPESVLKTARRIESGSARPTNPSYNMEMSSERLSIGSRYKFPDKRPREKQLPIADEDEQDLASFKAFIDGLQNFCSQEFELQLLYDIARGHESEKAQNALGDYFTLKDKVNNMQGDLGSLEEFSRIQRDILRALVSKGAQDEAILIEMIWRSFLKIIDNVLVKSNNQYEQAMEQTQINIQDLKHKYKLKIKRSSDEFAQKHKALLEEIHKKKEIINELNDQKSDLQFYAAKLNKKLYKLTKMEAREVSCIEMNRIFAKLEKYINDSEENREMQSETISAISGVLEVIQEITKAPEVSEETSQTDLSMPITPFSELPNPIISEHPFYSAYMKNYEVPDIDIEEAFGICQKVLEEEKTNIPFIKQLIFSLLKQDYSFEQALGTAVKLALVIKDDLTEKSQFFSVLLGFPRLLPPQGETFILSLHVGLKELPSENISIQRVLEFMVKYLPKERNVCEAVLNSVKWTSFQEYSLSANVMASFCKVSFMVQKQKKSMKALLEALDPKKEGHIYRNTFSDWCRNKMGCWVTEAELAAICDLIGGVPIKISDIYEKFNSLGLVERSKEITVNRYNLILRFIDEYCSKYDEIIGMNQNLTEVGNFSEYSENAVRMSKDPNNEQMVHLIVDKLLGVSIEKTLKGLVDFNLIKIEEIERNVGKKQRRRRK